MRIGWTPPLPAASQRRETSASADRSFSPSLENDPATRVSLSAAAALSSVEGLLSLQEVTDTTGGRKRAIRHGEKLLDALDELRHAMLMGELPREQILQLQRLAAETSAIADDPRLQEVIAEIELRAAVELAKLGEFA